MRARRCEQCRLKGESYCEHNGVLLVFINEAPVIILSRSEDRARHVADLVKIKLTGKRFNKRHEVLQ